MIQRKQTLYLIAALILTISCLCLPLGTFTDVSALKTTDTLYNLWIVGENGKSYFSVWALFAVLLVTCPIAIISIFMYHNRIVQSRFCMFNILLIIGWYIILFVIVLNMKSSSAEFKMSVPVIFPALSLILYVMARKAILSDEALVKAADRIR